MRSVGEGLEGYLPFNFGQYLAVQANQYSVLQVYFVVVTIVFGLLAFYGFAHIKEAAVGAAAKAAEDRAKVLCEEYLTKREPLNLGAPTFPSTKNQGED